MQNAHDEKKKTRLEILLPHSVPSTAHRMRREQKGG